jgi:2-dehydro-3-deoxygluconokinase
MIGSDMNEAAKRAICIGDATIELARGGDGRFALSSSGDAFNTAIYLARAGQKVAFATALGDDPYSDAIVALAAAEGIGTDLITRVKGRLPALALVDSDLHGAKRTHVWGASQPARDLFELPDWSLTAAALTASRLVYFSGITLSLYSNVGIGRFLAALELARSAGVRIAFDGNFRSEGWHGDLPRARAVFTEALKRVDIALPSYDDEAALWGDASPDATVERLQAFGIGEIVVKNGTSGALVATTGARDSVPVPEVVTPVDVTAAGDGFNAGYLAARLAGRSAVEAASAAHRLAGQVIRHRGAIVPRSGAAVH